MKRYASHFLFIPEQGYVKQYVVEVENGSVLRTFPLTEELEDVEWYPGVMVLCREGEDAPLTVYLYYPFDFNEMQPVAETQRRQLL